MSSLAYVGFDAHAVNCVVCVFVEGSKEPLLHRTIATDRAAVLKLLEPLSKQYTLQCCYEASGIGYVIYRWLQEAGIPCQVIAPSLIPRRPGDRIKTDRRDARNLAELYRAGVLTTVHIPTEQEESVRSLVRLRETMVREVVASKNYIQKFLACRGIKFTEGKKAWTDRYWDWLRKLVFSKSDQLVWSEYVSLLEYKLSRVRELDRALEDLAQSDRYREPVKRLGALRGFGTITALTLITEIMDFTRFGEAGQIMSYVGMTPSESSSGGSRRQGSITKAGNARCRRVLVEAAWHYQCKPNLGVALKKRHEGVDADVVAHSWRAQHRLHKKFWRIAKRTDSKNKAVVAVARELVGFVWAIMTGRCTAAAPARG
jgi:transposase